MSAQQARDALTRNPRACILHGQSRRATFKGVCSTLPPVHADDVTTGSETAKRARQADIDTSERNGHAKKAKVDTTKVNANNAKSSEKTEEQRPKKVKKI